MERLLDQRFWIAIALYFAMLIFSGYSLSILWLWYVVPLGMQAVNIAWGVGLICLSSIFRTYTLNADDDYPIGSIIFQFLMVAFALFIGWIAQHFLSVF